MGKDERRVIPLHLNHAYEMFEMPQADLFSEYRNFLTGVDYCISELRSHPGKAPIRLEVSMPDTEVDDEVANRIGRTMRRYCDHRIAYNKREQRASRFDGAGAGARTRCTSTWSQPWSRGSPRRRSASTRRG